MMLSRIHISVREEGQDKAEWNMRMAYAYQYLHGQEEKAIPDVYKRQPMPMVTRVQ